MSAFLGMCFSGAVEAAAGTIVSGAVSSVSTTCEIQDGLDLTLYSLHQEIMKIQCVIEAARRRRITNPKFHEWMASLINTVCIGNYYLRTFGSQNQHPFMIENESMGNLMGISPSYRAPKRRRITLKTLFSGDEPSKKINDVLKMLKSIDTVTFMHTANFYPERPIKTYLYMDHNRLFSRDKERDQVMRFLLEPGILASENNVDILPIVGTRGVGKTSLALHCFHDPKVQTHFSMRLYINAYNMTDSGIYIEILDQCNVTKITHRDENTLIAMLKQNLSSERFLLVMDVDDALDVEFQISNALLDCLRCGEKGSKVILNCHPNWYNKYKKFLIPRTAKPIFLDRFPEEDYMLFFKGHAFGSADPDDYPELEQVGREIATVMNGSIWGAKIFGDLLRDNLTAEFWDNFLEVLSKDKFQRQHCNSLHDLDLFSVIRVISHILSKPLTIIYGCCLSPKRTSDEVKSYRELMVLGTNHWTPVNKSGGNCLEFSLTKHIFLNKCTFITGELYLV